MIALDGPGSMTPSGMSGCGLPRPRSGSGVTWALALLCCLACLGHGVSGHSAAGPSAAVILSSSRGWLNYRHTANAMAVYQAARM